MFQKGKSTVKGKVSKNNFQDRAMINEKLKGEREEFDTMKFPVRKLKSTHSNDPQWYFKSADILKDVASFSYGKPLGTALNLPTQYDAATSPGDISSWNAIPGVMSLVLAPTVGISINAQSPLNLGAQNIYTRVRYKNSGAANYDPPDLMLYYIAMSSLYSAWNWMKRIYGYASKYSATNWYKAPAYAKLDKIDLEDIVRNLANFRAYLNMAADRISAFCVPSVFSYMIRHSWLYSNIYKDADTTKAQEYMFTPAFFYMYDEMTSSQGGKLVPINILLNGYDQNWTKNFSDLRDVLDTMINRLQYSSDIGNMSGDTLKEFGDNLFKLSHIDPEYTVDSVYDKEVLTQFENAVWTPLWDYATQEAKDNYQNIWALTQDPNTNFLKFDPTMQVYGTSRGRGGIFYNFHWDNPTPEDVMVASRINMVDYDSNPQDTGTLRNIKFKTCGSEIAIRCTVVHYAQGDIGQSYKATDNMQLHTHNLGTIYFGNSGSQNTIEKWRITAEDAAQNVFLWTAFDWAPPLFAYVYLRDTTPDTPKLLPDLRDWDVYTFATTDNLIAMNTLALTSMFNVPN